MPAKAFLYVRATYNFIKWDYVKSALRPSFTEGDPNWTAGYGYYFWQNAPTLSGFHGVGLHGHYCIVLPKYNMVCATTAEGDMFRILHALEEEIINLRD